MHEGTLKKKDNKNPRQKGHARRDFSGSAAISLKYCHKPLAVLMATLAYLSQRGVECRDAAS